MTGYVQGAIQTNLNQVFGTIGGIADFEVLNLKESGQFSLKVYHEDLQKVRAAIALIAQFQGIPCHFKVHRVTSVLVQTLVQ